MSAGHVDRRAARTAGGAWDAPSKGAATHQRPAARISVLAFLVVLLGAYGLVARELFLTYGEPPAAVTDADHRDTSEGAAPGGDVAGPSVAADGSGTALARGNPARTGEVAGVGPSGLPSLLWSVQTGGEIVAEPVVADGVVYLAGTDGILYALAATSGAIRWRFPTPGPLLGPVSVANGVVYVVGSNGVLHAIDADTGQARWSALLGTNGDSRPSSGASPVAAGDTVYVGGGDAGGLTLAGGQLFVAIGASATVHAVAAETGATRWAIAPEARGVAALDPADGTTLWHHDLASSVVAGMPVVRDGVVYLAAVGRDGGKLVALDAATGRPLRWDWSAGNATTMPAIAGDGIVVGALAGTGGEPHAVLLSVRAGLDGGASRERWRSDLPPADSGEVARSVSAPTVAGETVYAGTSNGVLAALDLTTGQERWRFDAGTALGPPAVANGFVFAGGSDGRLLAIASAQTRDSTPPAARTPTPQPSTQRFHAGQTVHVVVEVARLRSFPTESGDELARLPRGASLEVIADGPIGNDEVGRWWRVRPTAEPSVEGYVREDQIGDGPAAGTVTPDTASGLQPGEIVLVMDPGIKLYRKPGDEGAWIEVLSMRDSLIITGPRVEVEGAVWWPVDVFSTGGSGWVKEADVVGSGRAPEIRVIPRSGAASRMATATATPARASSNAVAPLTTPPRPKRRPGRPAGSERETWSS